MGSMPDAFSVLFCLMWKQTSEKRGLPDRQTAFAREFKEYVENRTDGM